MAGREPGLKSPGKENLHQAEAGQVKSRRHRHEKHGQKAATRERRSETPVAGQLRTDGSSTRADIRNTDEDEPGYFIVDRKYDQQNIKYGTPDRYSVPNYREAGRHRLLGLPRHFKTTPELEHGRRLITDGNIGSYERHGMRSLLRSRLSKESSLSQIVPLGGNSAEVDAQKSYLPLSIHQRKRRKLNDVHSSDNNLPENLHAIQSHHDAERPTEEVDTESISASTDSDIEHTTTSTYMDTARARYIHLSRLVDENPADVNAWLALIQHQDLMMAEGDDGPNKPLTNAEKHALADIKLSMYEKALSKTKGHPLQDQLISGMMNEGAKIWDTKKLAKEWMSILKGYPNSLGLWVQYLNFRQSSFITLDYESCRALFKDCLGIFMTSQVSLSMDCTRIYVFLRMTTFMREAGFSEHAHASWQAILEYCFFEPSGQQASSELSSFEDFWDSEVPRFGEEAARGLGMSQVVEAEPSKDPTIATIPSRNLSKTWAACERQKMTISVLPARTIDEADEDDPYRVILFSDIQPFLFRPSGLQARQVLIEALLRFCELPPLRFDLFSSAFTLGDPFLNNSFLEPCHQTLDSWLISSERNDPYHFPLSGFVTDTLSLYAGEHWFNPWKALQSVLSNKARREWIQRSLRQLLAVSSNDELLAEYVVAFELQLDVKEARKNAKSLLKQCPSIRLYNSFALLECSASNIGAAERVWSTTLSMHSSFPEPSHKEFILIWRSWLWALLDRQDFSKALRLCLAIPDEKVDLDGLFESGITYLKEHPTSKLRVHQYLTSHLNQNLSMRHPDMALHYLDILSLFSYLTSERTLPIAISHYHTTSSHPTITSSSSILCLLHQSRSRLLHLHATTSPSGFRLRDIITPLTESIRLFPSNTIFLSLYHFHTRRSLLTDRIRDVLPTLTSSSSPRTDQLENTKQTPDTPNPTTANPNPNPSPSVIPTLFNIYTELNRPTYAGSTSHSIRVAFEKAVSDSDSPSSHSPLIWKLYIFWELHVAKQEQSMTRSTSGAKANVKGRRIGMGKVVETLHRAIRACPWVKELYMLAFEVEEVRGGMEEAELRAVYEMMLDKGLRVHEEMGGGEIGVK